MSESGRGMGRGLSAILGSSKTVLADNRTSGYRELAVDLIKPNPSQPRTLFDEDALRGLSESIASKGLVQPLLVRPLSDSSYELIAGERRLRAAKLAGLEKIPVVIEEHSDSESVELAVIENMAREDLNPVEEARACLTLVEDLGLSKAEVARRVGRSRVAVSNLIRLLDLPEEALALIEKGILSEGHGRALLLADDHSTRKALAKEARLQGLSVRQLEDLARASNGAKKIKTNPDSSNGRVVSADEQAWLEKVSDQLTSKFGSEVHVKQHGSGYQLRISFSSTEQLESFTQRAT